jgi:hypothetical protein
VSRARTPLDQFTPTNGELVAFFAGRSGGLAGRLCDARSGHSDAYDRRSIEFATDSIPSCRGDQPLFVSEHAEPPFDFRGRAAHSSGTVAARQTRTAAPEHVCCANSRRPAAQCSRSPASSAEATLRIQTTTGETFEAQLRADGQNVLWLIDATDGRYQLAVALQGRLAHRRRDAFRAGAARGARVR